MGMRAQVLLTHLGVEGNHLGFLSQSVEGKLIEVVSLVVDVEGLDAAKKDVDVEFLNKMLLLVVEVRNRRV
jgi:hypothetical protein